MAPPIVWAPGEPVCRDYGERPGCLGVPDERYTMPFDDIGKPPLHWCAHCGPEAQAITKFLEEALLDPGFRADFTRELERAKESTAKG